jgi:hypothetical protein
MNKLELEYVFVHHPLGREDLPSLSPDAATEDRDFRYVAQLLGSPPLVFEDGAKDYRKKRGIKVVKMPPDVLFCGSDLVVEARIREALLAQKLANIAMHPAVYIHDNGMRYEKYWYITFLERLDCWDRKTSEFEQDASPVRLGGFELFQIYRYHLDDEVLDKVPLNRRLLFKMGGSVDGLIVCHKSISFLLSEGAGGIPLTEIIDY